MPKVRIAAIIVFCSTLSVASFAHDPVESLQEMRQAGVVIQKWDISCGAAALATLLREEFGDVVTERQVALGLIGRPEYLANPKLVREREGFSLLDLKRYVVARGYRGEGLGDMTLEDLERAAPAIVPINNHGYNHFVVFRGVSGDRVVLADPGFGNRSMSIDRFMSDWIQGGAFGRVAFVIKRKEGS